MLDTLKDLLEVLTGLDPKKWRNLILASTAVLLIGVFVEIDLHLISSLRYRADTQILSELLLLEEKGISSSPVLAAQYLELLADLDDPARLRNLHRALPQGFEAKMRAFAFGAVVPALLFLFVSLRTWAAGNRSAGVVGFVLSLVPTVVIGWISTLVLPWLVGAILLSIGSAVTPGLIHGGIVVLNVLFGALVMYQVGRRSQGSSGRRGSGARRR